MGKNIVICSDGTGQRGGVNFDEERTNVYKLYRATRSAPDSSIDAAQQVACYDPGIGTAPAGVGALGFAFAWVRNLFCKATGLGLTGNIVSCYASILANYEAGDRIYLIGFSRGAYTVRCVAAVLSYCGVPTTMSDGVTPLKRDPASLRKIAREAVMRVYQHVGSEKDLDAHREERLLIARRFRERHRSEGAEAGTANAYPHFIGVFDTVAAIGSLDSIAVASVLSVAWVAVLSAAVGWAFALDWTAAAVASLVLTALVVGALYLRSHVKVAFGLPGISWWKTLHVTGFRLRFGDGQLSDHVGWARHALSIDERRGDFDKVKWANLGQSRETGPDAPEWLEQVWFAGDHSDIGGGYPENESRLSDNALRWMADAAMSVPGGLIIDQAVMRPSPSAAGPQHDQSMAWQFRFGRKIVRTIHDDAPVHRTVAERYALRSVLQDGLPAPYRPGALRPHEIAGRPDRFSETVDVPAHTGCVTKFKLEKGRRYVLTATGTWVDAFIPCSADGYWTPPLPALTRRLAAPGRRLFTLMGCLAGDPKGAFPIGSYLELVPEVDGELRCFANDVARMDWNNWGAVRLTVRAVSDAPHLDPSPRQSGADVPVPAI